MHSPISLWSILMYKRSPWCCWWRPSQSPDLNIESDLHKETTSTEDLGLVLQIFGATYLTNCVRESVLFWRHKGRWFFFFLFAHFASCFTAFLLTCLNFLRKTDVNLTQKDYVLRVQRVNTGMNKSDVSNFWGLCELPIDLLKLKIFGLTATKWKPYISIQ